jgi:hypothetical protein
MLEGEEFNRALNGKYFLKNITLVFGLMPELVD